MPTVFGHLYYNCLLYSLLNYLNRRDEMYHIAKKD